MQRENEENILLIGCEVLRHQIEAIGAVNHKFLYLEPGLHRNPDKLRQELQKVIDNSGDYSTLLLGYGLCSRAVAGLQAAPHQRLVVPKVDDCIALSLGSRHRYCQEFKERPGTYYFTKGWIEAAEDPLKEYHKSVAKFGEELALWAARECLKHYQRAVLIKTGEEELADSREYVHNFAQFFNLQYEEMEGSLDYLQQLLFGPWDDGFVVVEGGMPVKEEAFSAT
jgi:hypothetical protein